MTSTETILAGPESARAIVLRRLRAIRAQASFMRPRWWTSYVLARDLRTPLIGGDCPADIELTIITDPSHPAFSELVSVSRHVGIGRMRCTQYLTNGAVAVLGRVVSGAAPMAAACGWMTQANTPVPFLNARFRGGPDVCLLYQDFVLPEFRGLGLQRMIGRRRLEYATERGVRFAYAYIKRANTPSLRNAIEFNPVALVHNLRCGRWAAAHVRALGHRTCSEFPFVNWPSRQAFVITPGDNRRLM